MLPGFAGQLRRIVLELLPGQGAGKFVITSYSIHYTKLYDNLYGTEAPADLLPDYRVSSTRLRLGNRWQPARNWHTESAIDYQLLGTDPAGVLPLQGAGVNRRIDLDLV